MNTLISPVRLRFTQPAFIVVSLGILCAGVLRSSAQFIQHNLVSDVPGMADFVDPQLINPWGVAFSPTSPFWIADNGMNVSTLYNGAGVKQALVVTMTDPNSGPTGVVFNTAGAGAFNGDNFLFVAENGAIYGWRGALGTTAERLQVSSALNVYKGAAEGTTGGNTYLYEANFRTGTVDILKGTAGAPNLAGNFTDPGLPSGYAPFNVQNIGNQLFVTYALQDGAKHDDVPGAGHGFIDVFDLNGVFQRRLVSGGPLDSPWGLALAPSGFGSFAGDLLVGNFGDGRINIFDSLTGAFIDQLRDTNGNPIAIDGLWALVAGNNGIGFDPSSIYFTAGSGDEMHGLFGRLSLLNAVPDTGTTFVLLLIGFTSLAAGRRALSRARV
ncbi:MAG: TIGR03118 family protein [Chthoniobacterales bacterium]